MLAVLGFDSVGVELVERMLADGRLPVLARLRAEGTWRPLETPARDFAAATYHTLYSGVGPGRHGRYYPFQWAPDEQRIRFVGTFPAPDAIWDRLAQAGRRSLVLDAYEADAPREAVGVFLSGWQLRNRVVLPIRSHPAPVGRRLARSLGRPPHVDEVFGAPDARLLARMRRHLVAAPARVAAAAADLLRREAFDLLWASFPAAHLAGHQFWAPELLPAGVREELRGALEDTYAAVDEAIGRILAALPGDADVLVVSPLGMTANASRTDFLPGMLARVLGAAPGDGHGDSLSRVRTAVPTRVRSAAAAALPDRVAIALTARLELRGTDWSSTRAFALPNDHHGLVRLNVRGRERDGTVDPGEADALLAALAEGLATFRDPSGEPSVESVARVRDLYDGPRVGLLPDLVVRWTPREAAPLPFVASERFGEVQRRGPGTGRTGNHSDEAWALVVPRSSRPRDPGRAWRLVDVAATVAAVAGVDCAGLEGESLLEPARA